MHICEGKFRCIITRTVVFRQVIHVVLTAGAGLAGSALAGSSTDAGQPLSAATAVMTQPAADSVRMRLPDDVTAVGLVMAIATPPG